MFKLSLSATSDPFPFAAIVLASFVKEVVEVKIDYDRDDTMCVLTRTTDGTQIEEGETIVRTHQYVSSRLHRYSRRTRHRFQRR